MPLFIYVSLVPETHHIFMFLNCVTFSPADDVIHVRRHSPPEAVVPGVALLRLHGPLLVLGTLVKPPKLPVAEQVGLAVVGPDEGCVHPLHRPPALSLHAPIGEGPRVSALGQSVPEDPVLRSCIEGGKCEKLKVLKVFFLKKKRWLVCV